MKYVAFLLVGFITGKCVAQVQITVITPVSDSALVGSIAGGGIAYSNITNNGAADTSRGLFSCGGTCNLGLSGGMLLTTGWASIAGDLNSGYSQGIQGTNLVDPDLASLNPGNTYDACVMEFDFIASSDSIRLDYIFASEEYNEYINVPDIDVFGFFVSGPGITGHQLITLIPGTNITAGLATINNGFVPSGNVPPIGPCVNCAYYIFNGYNIYSTAYDGLTVSLMAGIGQLQPGATYHLKLGVTDGHDRFFDSGVFVEEGSFRAVGPVWLFLNGQHVTSDTLTVCTGAGSILSGPAGFTYQWNTGATTQSIAVMQQGTYSLTVFGNNQSQPAFSDPVTFIVQNIPVPFLFQNGNQLFSSISGGQFTYSWTLNGNPVPGANAPVYTPVQSGCYAVWIADSNGCSAGSDTLCISLTGISSLAGSHGFSVTSDPSNGNALMILSDYRGEAFMLAIYDIHGRIWLQEIIESFPASIPTRTLAEGVYHIVLTGTESRARFTKRLLIY